MQQKSQRGRLLLLIAVTSRKKSLVVCWHNRLSQWRATATKCVGQSVAALDSHDEWSRCCHITSRWCQKVILGGLIPIPLPPLAETLTLQQELHVSATNKHRWVSGPYFIFLKFSGNPSRLFDRFPAQSPPVRRAHCCSCCWDLWQDEDRSTANTS
jgi:hypothetical protein